MSLTEFLLARIAEDEASAKAAIPFGTGEWETYTTGAWVRGVRQAATGNIICQARSRPNGTNDHIARHDPARVLAECEAKRRIVELHSATRWTAEGMEYMLCNECRDQVSPCPTLRAVATSYATHPDYCQEWAL